MAIEVRTTVELMAAVASAQAGETILLAPGVYDGLVSIRGSDFDPPIRIVSADPEEPVVFSGRMLIRDSSGIVIESVEFRLAADEPPSWISQLHLQGTERIEVRDVVMEGRVAAPGEGVPPAELSAETYSLSTLVEGYAFGSAVTVRDSSYVALSQLDISVVGSGVALNNVDRVALTDSHLHDIRRDGVTVTEASDVRIADNLFHSFQPLKLPGKLSVIDHSDFIQYWGSNGTRGIDGLEISGNAMLQTSGGQMHGILGRMATTAGGEPVPFRNFSIHDNVIFVSSINGMSLGDLSDSEVRNNTLLPAAPDYGEATYSSGVSQIRFPSDLRIDPDTGLRTPVRLPENLRVDDNLLATRSGEMTIPVSSVLPADYAERGIEIGANPTFSSDPSSPSYWAAALGVSGDAPWLDLAALTGRPEGGAAPLADWIVATAASIPPTGPGHVLGVAGDDDLFAEPDAANGTSRLYGEAGDDTLTGGAGDDTLVSGAGSDRMTGGAGRDMFGVTAGGISSGEVDVITDFDLSEGDSLLLNEGFPSYIFNDALDPENRIDVQAAGRIVFLDSEADLLEIAMHPGVTIVETGLGGTEIRFDFDRDGVLDYALRLLGYRIGYGRVEDGEEDDDGDGGAAGPDDGADDDPEPDFVATPGESFVILASELEAGASILLKGFAAGFFSASKLPAPAGVTDGSAVLIDAEDDLAALAATPGVFARALDGETVELRFGSDDGDASFRIEGLGAGEAWRIVHGDPGGVSGPGGAGDDTLVGGARDDTFFGGAGSDRLVGLAGADWLDGGADSDYLHGGGGSDTLIGGAGGDRYVAFAGELTPGDRTVFADIDFSEGDNIYLGRFAPDAFAAVGRGGAVSIRSLDQLVALGEADWIDVERSFGGITLTLEAGAGAHRFVLMLDDATLARADGLLGG